jgi:hypothetical protein
VSDFYVGDTVVVAYPMSFEPYSKLNGTWKAFIRRCSKYPLKLLSLSDGGVSPGWSVKVIGKDDKGWIPTEWLKLLIPVRQGQLFL